MRTSEQINEIAAAMSALQTANKGAEIGAVNPFFKSKYSTLENVWNCIYPLLAPNGLSVVQDVQTKETCVAIVTLVMHKSGQFIEYGPFEMPFAKRDAHSIGSAAKYGRRYALSAAFSVVGESEDDDGNTAMPDKTVEDELITIEQMEWLHQQWGDNKDREQKVLDHFRVKKLADLPKHAFLAVEKNIKTAQKVVK